MTGTDVSLNDVRERLAATLLDLRTDEDIRLVTHDGGDPVAFLVSPTRYDLLAQTLADMEDRPAGYSTAPVPEPPRLAGCARCCPTDEPSHA